MVRVGVVLGRFQPFHKGHLKYVLLGLRESKNLIIGITTPGERPSKYEPRDPQRFGIQNNPFTYFERKKMIKESLEDEGINSGHVKFIHFKPSRLDLWFKKVPKSVTYFLTLTDTVNKQADQMRSQGLKVKILEFIKDDRFKGLNVRKLMKANSKWVSLVPKSVAKFLKEGKSVKKVYK